jgi:hypothetical protein
VNEHRTGQGLPFGVLAFPDASRGDAELHGAVDPTGMPVDRAHPLWRAAHDPAVTLEEFDRAALQWERSLEPAAEPRADRAMLTLEVHDDQEGTVLNEALRDFASRQRQAARHGHDHLRQVRTQWALVADRLADRVDQDLHRR